jgi:hypothetical protein
MNRESNVQSLHNPNYYIQKGECKMRNDMKAAVMVAGIGAVGLGAAWLIAKAVYTGNSELAKLSIDAANDIAKTYMNNDCEKTASDISTEAVKAEIDVFDAYRKRW